MKALILAGGQGMRLRSVIKDIPKPMAPIAGKPFLEYIIRQLAWFKIRDIVLSVGYQSHTIQDYFKTGTDWGVNIAYSFEEEPLGTGGAIKKASPILKEDDFLVLNGDSFFNLDITKLINLHRSRQAMATIGLTVVQNEERYGVVCLGDNNSIIGFAEKKYVEKGIINAGCYVFSPTVFNCMPNKLSISLEEDVLPNILEYGVFGEIFEGYFVDIGIPDDYLNLKDNPKKIEIALRL